MKKHVAMEDGSYNWYLCSSSVLTVDKALLKVVSMRVTTFVFWVLVFTLLST